MSLRQWIQNFPIAHYVAGFTMEIITSVLKTGPVPKHIAFIMDGNRRFAKQNSLELGEGHVAGFESMSNVRFFLFFSPTSLLTFSPVFPKKKNKIKNNENFSLHWVCCAN